MDLKKINSLPKISRPRYKRFTLRRGKLRGVRRSSNTLSQEEFEMAKKKFSSFDIDRSGAIDYDELKALLLQLNLRLDDDILDDYMELELGINRSIPGSMDFERFKQLFSSILSNQTEYFRHVYSYEKKPLDFQHLAERNQQDAKNCFSQYDENQNGFLEADELRQLFLDMGHTQVKKMQNFDEWLEDQYQKFDKNNDGLISYEEFINLHNIVVESYL